MKINKDEIINYYNKTNGFSTYNNIVIDSIENDNVVLSCETSEKSMNPLNLVHGGLIFGIGDNACGVLAFLKGTKAVTVNSTIDYLKPCTGKRVKCIAYPIKEGKTIGVYKADIYNDSDELVSIMTCTYYFLKEE